MPLECLKDIITVLLQKPPKMPGNCRLLFIWQTEFRNTLAPGGVMRGIRLNNREKTLQYGIRNLVPAQFRRQCAGNQAAAFPHQRNLKGFGRPAQNRLLGLATLMAQCFPAVRTHGTTRSGEACFNPSGQCQIDVVAAQMGITIGGLDFHNIFPDFQN